MRRAASCVRRRPRRAAAAAAAAAPWLVLASSVVGSGPTAAFTSFRRSAASRHHSPPLPRRGPTAAALSRSSSARLRAPPRPPCEARRPRGSSRFRAPPAGRTPWALSASSAARSDAVRVELDAGGVSGFKGSDDDRLTGLSTAAARWSTAVGQDGGDGRQISSLLVCGDGDLSYSAAVAPELAALGIRLTATVLEDRERHRATYRNSRAHADAVLSFRSERGGDDPRHEVVFGVDATDLSSALPNRTFDRIQFNFPHWRGKANHRHNRALLSDFLRSAAAALTPNVGGEVHVALCEGQGGATASSREEWRRSWKAAEYANEHGLLLMDVSPYRAEYDLSSHRGMDRAFTVGKVPKMYVFGRPEGGAEAAREFQLCCRHELHVNLPEEMDGDSQYSLEDIVEGDAVKDIVESVVPHGVRVEVPMRKCLAPEETGSSCRVGVYLVVYAGEGRPLTRAKADDYRARVEREVANHIPLRANRANRTVSRPFPYPLLQGLIDHYLSRG